MKPNGEAGKNLFIMFVTGVSTAGKTTVYRALKNRMPDVDVRDIDENGIPDAGTGHWRKFRVELLLHEAVKSLEAGRSTIVCGATFPHEVTWADDFSFNLNLWFVMLQVSGDQIHDRLTERLKGRFPPDVAQSIRNNIDLQPRIRGSVLALRRGVVIDVGNQSKDEMLGSVLALVGLEMPSEAAHKSDCTTRPLTCTCGVWNR